MRTVKFIICVLALGARIHASAQSQAYTAKQLQDTLDKAHSATVKSDANPLGSGAVVNAISNVAVSSTLTGGADGKITATRHFKNFLSASITVDQTLGKADSSATFYDFSKGISPGTTITFNLQKFFWNPKLSPQQFSDLWDLTANKYAKEKGVDRKTVTQNEILTDGTQEEKDAVSKIPLKMPVFFNLQVAFNKASFSYTTDSTNLKKSNSAYLLPAIKAHIGFALNLQSYLSFSYLYSDTYQAGTSMTFESPFGSSKNQVSQTLNFGAPKETKDSRVGIEFRRNYGGDEPVFAIDPTVTYGLTSKKISFELPLYFIKGVTKAGKLTDCRVV